MTVEPQTCAPSDEPVNIEILKPFLKGMEVEKEKGTLLSNHLKTYCLSPLKFSRRWEPRETFEYVFRKEVPENGM